MTNDWYAPSHSPIPTKILIFILRCCWPIDDVAIRYIFYVHFILSLLSPLALIQCQILWDRNGNIYIFCQINQFALETQNNGIMTVAATSLLFRVWIPVLVNRSCSIRGVWALGARPDRKSALTFGQILSQLQGELHNLVRLALNYIS